MVARLVLWVVCPLLIAGSVYMAAFHLWLFATPDRDAAAPLFYRWLTISLVLLASWLAGVVMLRRSKRRQ